MMKKTKTKQCTIQSISKYYGFKKTNNYVDMMFASSCFFWETKYANIYITDYNFVNDTDLKKIDSVMLFYRNKHNPKTQLISCELLEDESIFNNIIESFYNKCNINKI